MRVLPVVAGLLTSGLLAALRITLADVERGADGRATGAMLLQAEARLKAQRLP